MQKSQLKEIVLEQEKDRRAVDTGIPRAVLSAAAVLRERRGRAEPVGAGRAEA